jgi:hypothetical protein
MMLPTDCQGFTDSCQYALAVLLACWQDEHQPSNHSFFAGGLPVTITLFQS